MNMELGRVWYQSDNDFRIPKGDNSYCMFLMNCILNRIIF